MIAGEAVPLDLGDLEVDEFAEFWSAYPRKKDRSRALIAYRRARHVAFASEILAAARRYADEVAGRPVEQTRWAVEWLRAEPWKPNTPEISPRPPARARRRRDPSKPRRAPHRTAPVRPSPAEQRATWIREHGLTEDEYEARKGDAEWLKRVELRGRIA